jgi:hypothetical protein
LIWRARLESGNGRILVPARGKITFKLRVREGLTKDEAPTRSRELRQAAVRRGAPPISEA